MVVLLERKKREKKNLVMSEQKRTAPLNTLGAEILTSKSPADFPSSIPKIRPTPSLSPNPLNLSPYHSLI